MATAICFKSEGGDTYLTAFNSHNEYQGITSLAEIEMSLRKEGWIGEVSWVEDACSSELDVKDVLKVANKVIEEYRNLS